MGVAPYEKRSTVLTSEIPCIFKSFMRFNNYKKNKIRSWRDGKRKALSDWWTEKEGLSSLVGYNLKLCLQVGQRQNGDSSALQALLVQVTPFISSPSLFFNLFLSASLYLFLYLYFFPFHQSLFSFSNPLYASPFFVLLSASPSFPTTSFFFFIPYFLPLHPSPPASSSI